MLSSESGGAKGRCSNPKTPHPPVGSVHRKNYCSGLAMYRLESNTQRRPEIPPGERREILEKARMAPRLNIEDIVGG